MSDPVARHNQADPNGDQETVHPALTLADDVEALIVEIRAKGDDGRRRFTLHHGVRLGPEPDGAAFSFPWGDEGMLMEGAPVEFVTAEARAKGQIQSLSADRLIVSLDTDLGPQIPKGVLLVDDLALLVRLWERLKQIAERPQSETGFHLELAETVRRNLSTPQTFASADPSHESFLALHEGQKQAVRHALANPATYLWGPPGTGKTRTLAALCEALMERSDRILVCAPTNIAVDQVLHQICKALSGRGMSILESGGVLRLGRIADEALDQDFGEYVRFDKAADRLAGPLVQDRARIERARADRALEKAALERDLAGLEEDKADLAKGISAALDRIRAEEDRDSARLAAISHEIQGLRPRMIAEARVLGATLTRAYLMPRELSGREVVILDEASMALMPAAWAAIGLAQERAIISGDFMQLPAIAQSDDPALRARLGQNLFESAGLAQSARQGGDRAQSAPNLAPLTRQWRMAEEICALIARPFYGGKLETAPDRTPAGPRAPAPFDQAVTLLDTQGLNPTAERDPGVSRQVRAHARAIALLAQYLGRAGWLSLDDRTALGVVSPFRAQAKLIRSLLEADGWGDAIIARTVHRFQGDERRMIVYDVSEARPLPLARFSYARDLAEDGAKLLNVALSRARDHIVIVADLGHMARTLYGGTLLGDLLGRAKRSGRVVSAAELLGRGELDFAQNPRPARAIGVREGGDPNACPRCGQSLLLRNGRFGQFQACPDRMGCGFTRNAPQIQS